MNEYNKENRTWYRHWLKDVNLENGYAVTLTLKQRFNNITTTVYEAQKNMTNFISRLSRIVYGNNYKRRNQKLVIMPSYETKGRQHYHAAIDFPDNLDHDNIYQAIKTSWVKTPLGLKQHNIKRITNHNGWVSYITKLEKQNDTVDVINLHV